MVYPQFCLLVLLAVVVSVCSEQKTFHGNKVFRLFPSDQRQLQIINKLSFSPEHFDFWSHTSVVGSLRPIYLHVAKQKVKEAQRLFEEAGIKYQVHIEDVQKLVDSQDQTLREKTKTQTRVELDESFYEHYHTYEENMVWLGNMAQTYSNMSDLFCLGKTIEGRMLIGLRLYSPVYNGRRKRSIFINSGIHAREWITMATVNYVIGHMISDYEEDPVVKRILEETDIYFLPIMNPDGYAYSWTNNRLWRKNRNPNNDSVCQGVDLNRNWGFQWGLESGSSNDTCSGEYRGTGPFSELETSQVSQFIAKLPNLVGVVDVHSFSQLWMYPWDWTSHPIPNSISSLMSECANVTMEALVAVNGTQYQYGPGSILYLSSGTTDDWAYGALGVVYAATIELRDLGRYGFVLPEDQIIPSGKETYEAFKAYFQFVINHTSSAA